MTTVQTASRSKTLPAVKAQGWQLCIVDEAHHTAADTWLEVLFHTGFIPGPVCIHVGIVPELMVLHVVLLCLLFVQLVVNLQSVVMTVSCVCMCTYAHPQAIERIRSGQPPPYPDKDTDNDTGYGKLLVGVTATPYRQDDGQVLKHIFQRMAYTAKMSELINEGYLAKVRARVMLKACRPIHVCTGVHQ